MKKKRRVYQEEKTKKESTSTVKKRRVKSNVSSSTAPTKRKRSKPKDLTPSKQPKTTTRKGKATIPKRKRSKRKVRFPLEPTDVITIVFMICVFSTILYIVYDNVSGHKTLP